MINKVLVDGQTIQGTSIEYGVSNDGMLNTLIKKYKEVNYVIVEKRKGLRYTMTKEIKKYKEEEN